MAKRACSSHVKKYGKKKKKRTVSVSTLTYPAVTICLSRNWTKMAFQTFELTEETLSHCSYAVFNKCNSGNKLHSFRDIMKCSPECILRIAIYSNAK